MRKALKVIAFALLGIVLIVLTVGVVLYRFPQLVLNTRTATWALERFAPDLLTPSPPKDFEFEVTSHGWSRFTIHIKGSDFCARVPDAVEKACFEVLDLRAGVNHRWIAGATLEAIGPATVRSSEIVLHESPPKPKEETEDDDGASAFGLSRDLTVRPISIHLESIRLSHKKAYPVVRGVKVEAESIGDHKASIRFAAEALSSASERIAVDGGVNLLERESYDGAMAIRTRLGRMKSSGKLDLRLNGDLKTGKSSVTGDGNLFGPTPYLHETRVGKLSLQRASNGAIDVETLFTTEFQLPGGALGRAVRLPSDIAVNGRFDPEGAGSVNTSLEGRFVEPSDTTVKASAQFGKGYRPRAADFVAAIDLRSLQALSRFLGNSPYEIPAPFRVLEGPVRFAVKGQWNEGPRDKTRAYPIELNMDLKSPNQRLALDGTGDFRLVEGKPAVLTINMNLKNVKIQAPNLDPILPIPFPANDARIKMQEISPREFEVLDRESKNPAMLLVLNVNDTGNPIEVLHPIFEPSLRFRLNYQQSETGAKMEANFLPTRMSFMGRKAQLRNFVFRSDSATDTMEFNGQLSTVRSGYTVLCNFSQKAKKTVIDLTSEPPLNQDDIISLLLFNEVSSDLEPEDQRSVSDTGSAVSKRALGFFSLWMLSSTPVESVNFDPATEIYSAKVKLPGGVSAEIGSDWERAKEVELRKRLSRRWAITTGVRTDEVGEQSQESFLEWFYRY